MARLRRSRTGSAAIGVFQGLRAVNGRPWPGSNGGGGMTPVAAPGLVEVTVRSPARLPGSGGLSPAPVRVRSPRMEPPARTRTVTRSPARAARDGPGELGGRGWPSSPPASTPA
jgi:hypothetical protein